MKISYLDGPRYYRAFVAGAHELARQQAELNRINVFPVADGDTGSNMAATARAVVTGSVVSSSLKETAASMADAAMMGARGNSGLIFAQYLYGFSREVGDRASVAGTAAAELFARAASHAREAVSEPVEGTMLTVMREWGEALEGLKQRVHDLAELIPASLHRARESLRGTTEKLEVLARNGVVDAGAKGFVTFLEGVESFLQGGSLREGVMKDLVVESAGHAAADLSEEVTFRFCTEAVLEGEDITPEGLRSELKAWGDSVVTVGRPGKVHIHVHTSRPADLFQSVEERAAILQPKCEDMLRQVQAAGHRRSEVALVVDSACDLPPELFEEHRIHMLPLHLAFGESVYLDKRTIDQGRFYEKLDESGPYPTTSQIPTGDFEQLFRSLGEQYGSIVAITLSSGLSGTWNAARIAAGRLPGRRIEVIDSRHLSGSMGLVVLEAAEAIREGCSHDEVAARARDAVERAEILVGAKTMKYLVRSGRVSAVKGLVGRLMNIKPVITLDEEGKAAAFGRAFGQRGLLKLIRKKASELSRTEGVRRYCVVHGHDPATAREWARAMEETVGRPPEFVMDIAPVIGLHAGRGAAAVCLLTGD
ncbi:MAG: DegV family protein [bacterium]